MPLVQNIMVHKYCKYHGNSKELRHTTNLAEDQSQTVAVIHLAVLSGIECTLDRKVNQTWRKKDSRTNWKRINDK